MASTAPLCREIQRAFPERPFAIEFWDGGKVPPRIGAGPTLSFRSPRALAQVLRSPGELGLGRAYVLGDADVDDLDGVIALLGRWHPPPLGPATRLRILAAAIRAAGLHRPPAPPAAELPVHAAHATPRGVTRPRSATTTTSRMTSSPSSWTTP